MDDVRPGDNFMLQTVSVGMFFLDYEALKILDLTLNQIELST